jgi:hypothetical protein
MNERRLSYRYRFKCEDELEHFDKLSDKEQENIERYIVQVICESFVEPADEDYITARLLVQKGMHRAFFWAASQALEKYLKAFLLMRGASVNQNRFKGHSIAALHSEACSVDGQLTAVGTKPHSEIKIHPNVAESFEEVSVAKFINDVEAHGSPDNRYNSFGVCFNSGYLFALDSFVFGLRQQIGVPSIQEILRKVDQGLVEAFYLYNPWFAPTHMDLAEIPNEDFNLRISSSVTILDWLISAHAPYGSRFVLQWLDKKMKLPCQVKQYLKGR